MHSPSSPHVPQFHAKVLLQDYKLQKQNFPSPEKKKKKKKEELKKKKYRFI